MPNPGLVSAQALDEAVAALAPLGRELRRSSSGGWSGRLWVSTPTDSCLVIMAAGHILFVASPSTLRDFRRLMAASGVQLGQHARFGSDDHESSLGRSLLRRRLIDPEGLRIALKKIATETLGRFLGEAEIQMQRRPLEPSDRWIERTTRLQRHHYSLSLEETAFIASRFTRNVVYRPQTPLTTVERLLKLASDFVTGPRLFCRLGLQWWEADPDADGDSAENVADPWLPARFGNSSEGQMVEAAAGTGWPVFRATDGALSISPSGARQAAALLIDGPSQPLVLYADHVDGDLESLHLRATVELNELHAATGHSIRRVDSHHIEQAVSVWHDSYGQWNSLSGRGRQHKDAPTSRPLDYRLL